MSSSVLGGVRTSKLRCNRTRRLVYTSRRHRQRLTRTVCSSTSSFHTVYCRHSIRYAFGEESLWRWQHRARQPIIADAEVCVIVCNLSPRCSLFPECLKFFDSVIVEKTWCDTADDVSPCVPPMAGACWTAALTWEGGSPVRLFLLWCSHPFRLSRGRGCSKKQTNTYFNTMHHH